MPLVRSSIDLWVSTGTNWLFLSRESKDGQWVLAIEHFF